MTPEQTSGGKADQTVNQHFDVQVYDEFVIKGNTGVLRCQIPSFVKEYVTVTSWIRDDGLVIHADSDFGECTSRMVTSSHSPGSEVHPTCHHRAVT
ncbi:hypothetical protein HPB47_020608 [Ixodes persulcatus]|uniref:Uncharacterized protein n=1 Tax=Ixodes persulcatus TaxID=34615 RepID=A0AC60QF04_IXOPE|nr:hypothetical protein HPB47_020608 [Ixodes persulcatus]